MSKKDKKSKSKLKKIKNATTTKTEQQVISSTRASAIANSSKTARLNTTITTDILQALSDETNKYKSMDILVDKTPFGKMALNVYTTLTNPDGEYTFVNPQTGKRTKKPENEWNLFCKQRFLNSDAGIEAVYDALVRSLYTRGDMALEVIVAADLSTVQNIAVIDPSTFDTFEWIDAENRYAIYQKRDDNKKVDLYTGNFMRFPYQPPVGSPIGSLLFEPAIQATTNMYQHLLDETTILNRIGYPRYKALIDEMAVLESAKPNEKDTFNKRQELMNSVFDSVESNLRGIGRDSDIITFKSNDIDILGGGINGSGIDVRAWYESDLVEMCNAYSLPKIYLNAESGGSYALGTAELEALFMRVENSRDNLTAIKEAIGTFFCRLKGYNAVCKFKSKPIEWQKAVDKWEAKLKELEYYRRAEEYNYISTENVVNELTGEETVSDNQIEYLTYSDARRGSGANSNLSTGENNITTGNEGLNE